MLYQHHLTILKYHSHLPHQHSDGFACRHLDADEAIVRGAAWYAANLSTTFRLNKKFGMSDGAPYPIVFKVSRPWSSVFCMGTCSETQCGLPSWPASHLLHVLPEVLSMILVVPVCSM